MFKATSLVRSKLGLKLQRLLLLHKPASPRWADTSLSWLLEIFIPIPAYLILFTGERGRAQMPTGRVLVLLTLEPRLLPPKALDPLDSTSPPKQQNVGVLMTVLPPSASTVIRLVALPQYCLVACTRHLPTDPDTLCAVQFSSSFSLFLMPLAPLLPASVRPVAGVPVQ